MRHTMVWTRHRTHLTIPRVKPDSLQYQQTNGRRSFEIASPIYCPFRCRAVLLLFFSVLLSPNTPNTLPETIFSSSPTLTLHPRRSPLLTSKALRRSRSGHYCRRNAEVSTPWSRSTSGLLPVVWLVSNGSNHIRHQHLDKP